ncbi:MAG: SMP-30/gluconolactonase/LRE family protein [Maribacter sp.]|uniref:SMP-30/gluconolactonase/LRE family protein n=1 Tax=Maribacter sp. TaxID=1897614 RepID=UPI003297BCA4
MKNYGVILFLVFILIACKKVKKESVKPTEAETEIVKESNISSDFSIEILDDAALEIIDPVTPIEVLASGFEWTEGPLWVEDGKYLLFSDIPNNKVYKLDSQNDTITYLHPSGFSGENFTGKEPGSNGLLLSPKGDLILMQHGDRSVSKMDAPLHAQAATYAPLIDNYKGKRLNSPNDGVFDSMGNLYFTDPPYGLPERLNDPERELDFQGVYCLLTSGELVLVDSKIKFPNGIGLSPDGRALYVAESNPEKAVWYAYHLVAPGKTKNRTLLADATHLVGKEGQDGLPDGLKVHSNGTLFATGPGGVWIFDPRGKILARINTGQKTANCALTTDEKTLFMTADDYILSVALK